MVASNVSLPVATIDKLAFGGSGVCRIDDKVCFVPYSCPGDTVSLQVVSEKKSYSSADIVQVLTPSPFRTTPPCPRFGVCGGCNWQHVHYDVQLEQKRQIFADTLWRGARVAVELISALLPAPQQYGYRSRVQFKTTVRQGKFQIGFYRQGSHAVIDLIDGCPLTVPTINAVLARCRSLLSIFSDAQAITQVSVDVGEQEVVVVIQYAGSHHRQLSSFLREHAQDFFPCTGIYLQTGERKSPAKVWGSERISYSLPSHTTDGEPLLLSYEPGSFSQINRSQNSVMLSVIRRLGGFLPTEKLLDLYCGNGNFTIPLAAEVASVIGIEGSEASIRSARFNCDANNVKNTEFICRDVQSGLRQLVADGRMFDTILLDPPRAGAADCIRSIAALNPDKIVYVSCNPGTLGRDCALLSDSGYRVIESVPLDMFPQTYHLESVTLLYQTVKG
ncbi:MAG TPA: 23S rRNA (uracil(1939)-C(5))-methyltransferase RlmD [Desulfuromonadales bacterium]|nr:23S rRNA (uracil(1939)-C(5))-methyltransferase RlmD [Desulfuromonadales bacterium]